MTKTVMKFYVEPEQLGKLMGIKERDGIPVAEQIRRGIDLWLAQRGFPKPKGAKRAKTERQ